MKMDKKKSSRTKWSKEESKNNKQKDAKKNQVEDKKPSKKEKQSSNKDNTNQGTNQYFCKDQKDSKNIIYEKHSDKSKIKPIKLNKTCNKNTIDIEDTKCKSINDDKKEQIVKKTSYQSSSEQPNYHKNVQRQSTDINFFDKKCKPKKAHDKNNIELHYDTLEEEERRSVRKKNKTKTSDQSNHHKNVQKQSRLSDIDSIDNKLKKKKTHYRKNVDLKGQSSNKDNTNQGTNQYFCKDQKDSKNIIYEKHSDKSKIKPIKLNKTCNKNTIDIEDTKCKSINDDKKEQIVKKTSYQSSSEQPNYHKNVQRQSTDINFFDKKCKPKKAHDKNNIELHYDTLEEEERRSVRKKNKTKTSDQSNHHKNVQKQSRLSDIDSIDNKLKKKKTHYRKNVDLKGFLDEIDEDIFNLSKDYSLAHCVAEDLRMGAGIAVDFKSIFGGVGKLLDQKLKIGDVGIVRRHDQYAFYLVTKKNSNGKPTMNTMEKALKSLLIKMKEHKLTKLGIPRIGCGLDKLDWSDTKSLIINIFSGSGIDITVCVPSKIRKHRRD